MSDPKNRVEGIENLESLVEDSDGMFFEYYQFDPQPGITIQDLLAVLSAMEIRFPTGAFNQLPEGSKKQFLVKTRDGRVFRYKTPK